MSLTKGWNRFNLPQFLKTMCSSFYQIHEFHILSDEFGSLTVIYHHLPSCTIIFSIICTIITIITIIFTIIFTSIFTIIFTIILSIIGTWSHHLSHHLYHHLSHHMKHKFSSSEFAAPQVPVLPWAVPCAAVDGPRSCARPLKMISCGRTDGCGGLGGGGWVVHEVYEYYTNYILYTIYTILYIICIICMLCIVGIKCCFSRLPWGTNL